jgi:peptidoglycan/LPS O-acetylase OafA/YrhL
MKLLGDASYSIYLFHYTVGLPLALHVQAALGLTPTHWMRITLMLVIDIVCSAAVGIAIHWFVEKPLLKWLRGLNERFVLKERPA